MATVSQRATTAADRASRGKAQKPATGGPPRTSPRREKTTTQHQAREDKNNPRGLRTDAGKGPQPPQIGDAPTQRFADQGGHVVAATVCRASAQTVLGHRIPS